MTYEVGQLFIRENNPVLDPPNRSRYDDLYCLVNCGINLVTLVSLPTLKQSTEPGHRWAYYPIKVSSEKTITEKEFSEVSFEGEFHRITLADAILMFYDISE